MNRLELIKSDEWVNLHIDKCTKGEIKHWVKEYRDELIHELTSGKQIISEPARNVCDLCGCHPNIVYVTEKGTHCQSCWQNLQKP